MEALPADRGRDKSRYNQFDISLNATYAKLSGKWNEVPKWSGVTVSQLI